MFALMFTVIFLEDQQVLRRREHQRKKFSTKRTPQMKRRMQPMQIPAKFFFYPFCLFSFILVLHAMHNDCHLFSTSMLIFIEDNKRNEYGGKVF